MLEKRNFEGINNGDESLSSLANEYSPVGDDLVRHWGAHKPFGLECGEYFALVFMVVQRTLCQSWLIKSRAAADQMA